MNPRKVVKRFIPKKAFKKIEPYGHLGEAVLFNAKSGFPGRGLKVIGVTGTNGKTTASFMIHRMLVENGYSGLRRRQ
jgi:UDP-N-acetylmuramoylalanine-D-glutamate ligase